jgi:hypothetical protein
MMQNVEIREASCIWQNPPSALLKDRLTEILLNVFSKLYYRDLGKVNLVCRDWHTVAEVDDLWKICYYQAKGEERETPPYLPFKERLRMLNWMKNSVKYPGEFWELAREKYGKDYELEINLIPNETLLKVLGFLPTPRDLARVSLVCKRWKEIATDHFLWREHLTSSQKSKNLNLPYKERLALDHISSWESNFPKTKTISQVSQATGILFISGCSIGKNDTWVFASNNYSNSLCIWDGARTTTVSLNFNEVKESQFKKSSSLADWLAFGFKWSNLAALPNNLVEGLQVIEPKKVIIPLFSIYEGNSFLVIGSLRQGLEKIYNFVYRIDVNPTSQETKSTFISFFPNCDLLDTVFLGLRSRNRHIIAYLSNGNSLIDLISINLEKNTTCFWQLEGEKKPLVALAECRVRKARYLAALSSTGKILFWNPHEVDGEGKALLTLEKESKSIVFTSHELDPIREKKALKKITRNHSKSGDWLVALSRQEDQRLCLDIWKPSAKKLIDSFLDFQTNEDLLHFEVYPLARNKFCIVILTSFGTVHVWRPASQKKAAKLRKVVTLPKKFDSVTVLTKGADLFAIATEKQNYGRMVDINYWKLTLNGELKPKYLYRTTVQGPVQFFSDDSGNVFFNSPAGLAHWKYNK